MFNNESTHTERQQVLQSLLGKGALGSLGSGVHSPEEINHLLARSEEEFETFQQVCLSNLTPRCMHAGYEFQKEPVCNVHLLC